MGVVRKALARGIAAGTLACAFATAGIALGVDGEQHTYTDTLETGGTVSMRLTDEGRPKVDQIKIEEISAVCSGGTGALDFRIYGRTPVLENRSFVVRSEDGTGGKALVRGRFSRTYKRVTGIVRVYGMFHFGQDGSASCDSEKQIFLAR